MRVKEKQHTAHPLSVPVVVGTFGRPQKLLGRVDVCISWALFCPSQYYLITIGKLSKLGQTRSETVELPRSSALLATNVTSAPKISSSCWFSEPQDAKTRC